MRSSHVRMFALLGALCGALLRSVAQTATPPVGEVRPPALPTPPAAESTAAATPPPGSSTSGSVASTLPITAKRPSLMVPRGKKEVEWRLSYSHSSSNAIFIDGVAVVPIVVVGQIGVERVRRDTLTSSIAGRYGLANNLLSEIRVPFRYQSDRYSVPEVDPAQERSVSALGLGDIEGSFSYQLPRRREEDVRWIVSLGAKSNTGGDPFAKKSSDDIALGSGFWNTKIGLTGVKISDPAAVFWNIGYTHNWGREDIPITQTNLQTGEQTIVLFDIKPGNTFDLGGGFAYAINHRLSVNTGMSMSFNGSSQSNGKKVPNSSVTSAALRLGMVWLTDNRFPVDLGLSIGLTDDSPDFNLDFRQSYKF